jgi:putative transport protein
MHWLIVQLREHVELALFLALAVGYLIGKIRVGGFQVGAVLGTLVAGLVIGQVGVVVPDGMRTVFFLMFLFAIGYRIGPQFFRGLKSSALPQVGLSALLCTTGLALTWALARLFGLDAGTAAGMLAGSLTSSGTIGTATEAIGQLGLPAAEATRLVNNVAAGYAVSYLFGMVLVVIMLPRLGPFLMRVDLAAACRDYEQQMGMAAGDAPQASAYHDILLRAYRLPEEFAGRTVADVEASWPQGLRAIVVRLRRGTTIEEAGPGLQLRAGDVLAIGGRQEVLVDAANPLLATEVRDRELLDVPTVTADLIVTDKRHDGETLGHLVEAIGPRGIFLVKYRRAGQDLPFGLNLVIERGDVLTVTGLRPEIERVAGQLGYVEWPTTATDMLLVAGAIFAGAIVGLLSVRLGQLQLTLSMAVGVLLAGLVMGHLRSRDPRFGRVPEASLWLFDTLGLTAFLALVGLASGPAVVPALQNAGPLFLVATVIVAILPHVVTILVGRYLVGLHPGILLGLCAGAGTSTPALAAIQDRAASRVPALGYGMACAVGNVLLTLWGTVTVLLLG